MARRLQGIGQLRYAQGFKVTTHEDLLDTPLHWAKPRRVFVCFMGDLFHDQVPEEFILRVFNVMAQAPRHYFHLLTKRPARMADLSPRLPWPPNVLAGATVENADQQFRIEQLKRTGAAVKYLCLEPLLGPIPALDLRGIGWVIVGGESGPGARPMHPDWVRSVRDQCVDAGVRFNFKQWGGVRRRETGRELDGRLWSESPAYPEPAAPREPPGPGGQTGLPEPAARPEQPDRAPAGLPPDPSRARKPRHQDDDAQMRLDFGSTEPPR